MAISKQLMQCGFMHEISATDAARRFSDLLDSVEHDGNSFTITRRGRAIAHIKPVRPGSGAEVKAVLRTNRPDPAWAVDLAEIRAGRRPSVLYIR